MARPASAPHAAAAGGSRWTRSRAHVTPQSLVRREATPARRGPIGLELLGHSGAFPEVHLVWGLAAEGRVRQAAVVLLNVELDELPHARDRIQPVQEEPVVFQGAPPGLDHRVRVVDLRHRENSLQETGLHQLADGGVRVLDAGVGEEGWGRAGFLRPTARLEKHGDRASNVEVIGELPGEDPPREVVDDGVEVRPRPVQQSDHGRVDVPDLVRPRGADPHRRTFRMNAETGTPPSPLSDEPEPGRW